MATTASLHAVADAPFIHARHQDGQWAVAGVRRWQSATHPDNASGWHWDGTTLHILSSRLGFSPLFYWQHGDGIALSPSLPRLLDLGAPSDIDHAALAVFLRIGFYLQCQTPFRAIRQLAPATDVQWPASILSSDYTIDHPSPTTLNNTDAIDRYASLFRDAVRRQIPAGDITLPLSGGVDSRHILFELLAAGCKPTAVTLHRAPPDEDDDMAVARLLSRHFGLDHVELQRDRTMIAAETEKNPLTDFCADEHAWMLPLRRHMMAHPDAVTFDGIAGDVLSAGLYLHIPLLDALRAGRLRDGAEMLLGLEMPWRNVLDPDFYASVNRDLAAKTLCAELERHLDAPNPVASYLFWNRTRREMSLFGFKFLGDVRMPYLDDAVYDLLASLPASFFFDGRFHVETINRAFPEHAALPYAAKSKSTRIGRWKFRLATLEAAPYFLRAKSSWFRPAPGGLKFLNLKTKPAEISRVIYLLQLENQLRTLGNRSTAEAVIRPDTPASSC